MLRFPAMSPLARGLSVAIIAGTMGVIVGGQPNASSAQAQVDPGLVSDAPYTLKCWQEGVQIFTAQEAQPLRGLDLGDTRGATFENQDGSRRVMLPLGGTTLCVADFARR